MGRITEEPNIRQILLSPSFLVGASMLVLWGLAIVFVFKISGPCDGKRLCELAFFYWFLVGIVPGAYLAAGLLAPPQPFMTGLALAVVHVAVAAVTALLPDRQSDPNLFDASTFVVVGFVVGLVLGVITTGVVGHATGWVWRRVRR